MLDPQTRLQAARTSSDYKKSLLPLHRALPPDERGCWGSDEYAADTAGMIDPAGSNTQACSILGIVGTVQWRSLEDTPLVHKDGS
jgi:hypothetical protein